jgi:hypothetical protein
MRITNPVGRTAPAEACGFAVAAGCRIPAKPRQQRARMDFIQTPVLGGIIEEENRNSGRTYNSLSLKSRFADPPPPLSCFDCAPQGRFSPEEHHFPGFDGYRGGSQKSPIDDPEHMEGRLRTSPVSEMQEWQGLGNSLREESRENVV